SSSRNESCSCFESPLTGLYRARSNQRACLLRATLYLSAILSLRLRTGSRTARLQAASSRPIAGSRFPSGIPALEAGRDRPGIRDRPRELRPRTLSLFLSGRIEWD